MSSGLSPDMVSDDVRMMLEAESELGLAFRSNLFIGREPIEPKECVTLFDTYGSRLVTLDGHEEHYQFASVQVRIRSLSYPTGMDLANRITAYLHGRAGEEWGEAFYTSVLCSSGPFLLEWDAGDRAVIVVNFDLQRRR